MSEAREKCNPITEQSEHTSDLRQITDAMIGFAIKTGASKITNTVESGINPGWVVKISVSKKKGKKENE